MQEFNDTLSAHWTEATLVDIKLRTLMGRRKYMTTMDGLFCAANKETGRPEPLEVCGRPMAQPASPYILSKWMDEVLSLSLPLSLSLSLYLSIYLSQLLTRRRLGRLRCLPFRCETRRIAPRRRASGTRPLGGGGEDEENCFLLRPCRCRRG